MAAAVGMPVQEAGLHPVDTLVGLEEEEGLQSPRRRF